MSPRKPAEVAGPDGGWGWVIVACSFLVHMFVVGTMYSLSVVYVVWLDYFGDGKGVTSWIISVAVALMFGIGPVPGTLSRQVGNRGVVIFGGILMSVGLFLSYFAVNVYYLMVSVGVITGTGAGCCYLPSVSMVAMYFTAKRSLAMGIAASGLGAGTFCMAPLLNWLLDYYGWRGCMLILSGISLNMCVLGALMQPLEKASKCCCWQKSGNLTSACFSSCPEEKVNSEGFKTSETCDGRCGHCSDFPQQNRLTDESENCSSSVYHQLPLSEAVAPSIPFVMVSDHGCLNNPVEKMYNAGRDSPHHADHHSSVTLMIQNNSTQNSSTQDMQTPCSAKDYYSIGYYTLISKPGFRNSQTKSLSLDRHCGRRVSGSMEILSHVKTSLDKSFSSQIEVNSGRQLSPLPLPESRHKLASLSNVQIMLTGSIGSLVFLEQSLTGKSKVSLHSTGAITGAPAVSGNIASDSELHPEAAEEVQGLTDDLEKPHMSKLGASVDIYVRLVQDGAFVVFAISNFLTNISFFMPVLYMVDRALGSGIGKGDAAMLISLYGAGNILGKLFFGWLADRKLVDRLLCYIACLTVCGAGTSLSALCGSSRELHSIYAFVFGCFIGAYVTLVPLVTIDLVGLAVVTESFSLLLCVMGVATVFGTPLAGWIFDLTGSYAISFVLHGVFLLVSALMLIPLMVMKRRHRSASVAL